MTNKDGWLDLPSGGAVEIQDGAPVRITDNGNYRVDDSQLLREAEMATDTSLRWRWLERSRRWRSRWLAALIRRDPPFRTDVAEVIRNACSVCGSEVGERNVRPDQGGPVEWAGEQCAHAMVEHHLAPDLAAGFECDGSCRTGSVPST